MNDTIRNIIAMIGYLENQLKDEVKKHVMNEHSPIVLGTFQSEEGRKLIRLEDIDLVNTATYAVYVHTYYEDSLTTSEFTSVVLKDINYKNIGEIDIWDRYDSEQDNPELKKMLEEALDKKGLYVMESNYLNGDRGK